MTSSSQHTRLNQSFTQTKRASFHTCLVEGKNIKWSSTIYTATLHRWGHWKNDRGRDDSRPDSCSGPHEDMWHHSHTSSTVQRGLQCIQGGNLTIRDELPTGPAWQTPAQPRGKGNKNVERTPHVSSVWNSIIFPHAFLVPTDPPSRKTPIITAPSILKYKCIRYANLHGPHD